LCVSVVVVSLVVVDEVDEVDAVEVVEAEEEEEEEVSDVVPGTTVSGLAVLAVPIVRTGGGLLLLLELP